VAGWDFGADAPAGEEWPWLDVDWYVRAERGIPMTAFDAARPAAQDVLGVVRLHDPVVDAPVSLGASAGVTGVVYAEHPVRRIYRDTGDALREAAFAATPPLGVAWGVLDRTLRQPATPLATASGTFGLRWQPPVTAAGNFAAQLLAAWTPASSLCGGSTPCPPTTASGQWVARAALGSYSPSATAAAILIPGFRRDPDPRLCRARRAHDLRRRRRIAWPSPIKPFR
jgi:hypothetical protein